jgi:acyl carrier protein
VEEAIAQIWSEVLGVERIGVEDDFFAIGGHSLRATQVLARIERTFEVRVPLRTLFEAPTVAALAAHVEAEAGDLLDAMADDLDALSDEELAALMK